LSNIEYEYRRDQLRTTKRSHECTLWAASLAALGAEPETETETVNWRRGLTRLGVAAAVIWLLIAGVVFRALQSIAPAMGWGEPRPPPGFLGVPLAMLILALLVVWVVRGFRGRV
jgi:hypothetical protein